MTMNREKFPCTHVETDGEERTFTLIELLVVVSIIAILAAILLPVLSNAKRSAKKVVCLNQQRQLMLAQMDHADDRDGELTPIATWSIWTMYSRDYGGWGDCDRKWTGIGILWIRNYMPDMHIPYCPANTNTAGVNYHNKTHGFVEDPAAIGRRWLAVEYHQRIGFSDLDRVPDPSSKGFYSDGFSYLSYYYPDTGYAVQYHHRDGYNIAYLDGSVEFYKDSSAEIANLEIRGENKQDGGWVAKHQNLWAGTFDR